jgi:hypothetical protein
MRSKQLHKAQVHARSIHETKFSRMFHIRDRRASKDAIRCQDVRRCDVTLRCSSQTSRDTLLSAIGDPMEMLGIVR